MIKRTLLLADDSITIQKVVNLTFADEGIEVVAVGDGNAAIQKLNEITPDLIMADVHMPGLNGYQICERIRQSKDLEKTPVILLVGSFEPFDEEEAKRVGADDFLTKPFQSIRQLVNKVAVLLNSETAVNGEGEMPLAPADAPASVSAVAPVTEAVLPEPRRESKSFIPVAATTLFAGLDQSSPLDEPVEEPVKAPPLEAPAYQPIEEANALAFNDVSIEEPMIEFVNDVPAEQTEVQTEAQFDELQTMPSLDNSSSPLPENQWQFGESTTASTYFETVPTYSSEPQPESPALTAAEPLAEIASESGYPESEYIAPFDRSAYEQFTEPQMPSQQAPTNAYADAYDKGDAASISDTLNDFTLEREIESPVSYEPEYYDEGVSVTSFKDEIESYTPPAPINDPINEPPVPQTSETVEIPIQPTAEHFSTDPAQVFTETAQAESPVEEPETVSDRSWAYEDHYFESSAATGPLSPADLEKIMAGQYELQTAAGRQSPHAPETAAETATLADKTEVVVPSPAEEFVSYATISPAPAMPAAILTENAAILEISEIAPLHMGDAEDMVLELSSSASEPLSFAPLLSATGEPVGKTDNSPLINTADAESNPEAPRPPIFSEPLPAGVSNALEEMSFASPLAEAASEDVATEATTEPPASLTGLTIASYPAPNEEAVGAAADDERVETAFNDLPLSPELIEAIAARVAEKLSARVVNEVAQKAAPDLADLIVQKMAEQRFNDG